MLVTCFFNKPTIIFRKIRNFNKLDTLHLIINSSKNSISQSSNKIIFNYTL